MISYALLDLTRAVSKQIQSFRIYVIYLHKTQRFLSKYTTHKMFMSAGGNEKSLESI